ncbi:GUN4 domain-containing protein [Nostoc sp. FACHB-133]|uniref:GUN4 domain-containing protein n=1 Tax=Nostoc sp. FACHB-133 TaxID=2692835 RepID=UPI0016823C7E|nr:GUN4 domain-containing protein [Nostoc sp. FACHB-133]MBD2526796.1 GUN4 domain-containing protein [Nostoc sp. FACHB-133]
MDYYSYLQEQQEIDFSLLKTLEDKLRYEDNPRQKLKWEHEIEEIKQRIQKREKERKEEYIKFNETKVHTKFASLSNILVTGFDASEVNADYTPLRDLLSTKKFKEADEETFRIMLWAVNRENEGFLEEKNILNFPCRDLRTIDQLWLASSGGKFGFSVQKQILIDVGGNTGFDNLKSLNNALSINSLESALKEIVGLAERVEWITDFDVLKKKEQLFYDLRAARGHLPHLSHLKLVEWIFEYGNEIPKLAEELRTTELELELKDKRNEELISNRKRINTKEEWEEWRASKAGLAWEENDEARKRFCAICEICTIKLKYYREELRKANLFARINICQL